MASLPSERRALLFAAGGVRLALRLAHIREIVNAAPDAAEVRARGESLPAVSVAAGVAVWAVAAVALAAFGWMALGNRGGGSVRPSPFPEGAQVVAVMSIDDRTNDAELARADVGRILADAFVQILYDCQGVQVVSPARIQSLVMGERRTFQDTGHDWDLARQVCREAGANTILSGALSRLGASLVLNATLTEIATGKLVGSFETRATGSEQILEALSMDIAPTMKKTLGSMTGVEIVGGRSGR